MESQDTIKITSFDMAPEIDPYKNDGTLTTTACTLQPEHSTIAVYQYHSGDGQTMWSYNGREIDITLDRNETSEMPDPAELRNFIESDEGQEMLAEIIAGYDTYWDGNNTRGRLSDEGQAALNRIERRIAEMPRDEFVTWTCDEWFNGEYAQFVNADSTPEQIAAAAAEVEDMARDEKQWLADDVEDHLAKRVAWLRSQRDED